TGIALTHLPVLYRYGGFGARAPQERQRRFLHDAPAYARLLERLAPAFRDRGDRRLGIAPHSLRAVSPELLDQALEMIDAIDNGAPVHIHIAEQTAEVEDCIAWSGRRPVEWLLDHCAVGARWCLVHATHMTDADTARLAASQAVAGLCPSTEANLGHGIFPAVSYLAQDGRFGIGSDSHIGVHAAEDLRLLEYGQRLLHRGRNLLAGRPERSTGRRLFDAACRGGAQALGLKLGAITSGCRADFVCLDEDAPALAGRLGDAALDAWIFTSTPQSPIREVYAGGRRVVENRRHVRAGDYAARYREALDRILQE